MIAAITTAIDFAAISTALATVGGAVIGLVLGVKGFTMLKSLAAGKKPAV